MSKPIKRSPEQIQKDVLAEFNVHIEKIKTIRANAEHFLIEWIFTLPDEQRAYLPVNVNWEILGGRRYLLIPTTDEQLTIAAEFGLISTHDKSEKELGTEELLKKFVSDSFVKNGHINTHIRRTIVAWSNGDYPYIFEASRGSDTMTISITGPEKLHTDSDEFLELYVNIRSRDETTSDNPHDRKSMDKAYQQREEGPAASTDEMFQEVAEAVQGAVREEIEPQMTERCQLATTDRGTYAVELFREFPNRESAVAFMKAQLEL